MTTSAYYRRLEQLHGEEQEIKEKLAVPACYPSQSLLVQDRDRLKTIDSMKRKMYIHKKGL